MTIVLNGTTGITNDGGYTGDGISFADTTPANTLVTDTSGNVGIGTSSPAQKLTVNGNIQATSVFFGNATSSSGTIASDNTASNTYISLLGSTASPASTIAMGRNGSESLRIDSSGNLLMGTTSGSNHRFLKTSAGGLVAQFYNESTNTSSSVLDLNTNYTGNTTGHFIRAGDNAAYRFYVYTNGNVINTNGSYGAISDIKLKENIVDATPKLEKLNQVRVVNYNLKGETQKQIGVIAQELEQVFPSMIDETADRDEEGNDLGTTTKSVKYSVFVPMLIKALQEQQAIITDLKSRIETLEAK